MSSKAAYEVPGNNEIQLVNVSGVRRDFIHSSYSELKKANPKFPFLVRECSGVKPRLIARYGALDPKPMHAQIA